MDGHGLPHLAMASLVRAHLARRAQAGIRQPQGPVVPVRRAVAALAFAIPALVGPLGGAATRGRRRVEPRPVDVARSAYQRVLAGDSTAFRANLRLGVMLSWQGKHDSALVFIARARRTEPTDLEARLIEAKVLAWAGHHAGAIARYDSVLVDHPGLIEAELGRARARAWRGDLDGATRGYRAVLAPEPRNAGRTRRPGLRLPLARPRAPRRAVGASRRLSADPDQPGRRELRDAVRAATRATTESRRAGATTPITTPTSGRPSTRRHRSRRASARSASVSLLEAADPVLDAMRVGGEAGLSWESADLQLTGAAGARRLLPDTADARTAATYRGRQAGDRCPVSG